MKNTKRAKKGSSATTARSNQRSLRTCKSKYANPEASTMESEGHRHKDNDAVPHGSLSRMTTRLARRLSGLSNHTNEEEIKENPTKKSSDPPKEDEQQQVVTLNFLAAELASKDEKIRALEAAVSQLTKVIFPSGSSCDNSAVNSLQSSLGVLQSALNAQASSLRHQNSTLSELQNNYGASRTFLHHIRDDLQTIARNAEAIDASNRAHSIALAAQLRSEMNDNVNKLSKMISDLSVTVDQVKNKENNVDNTRGGVVWPSSFGDALYGGGGGGEEASIPFREYQQVLLPTIPRSPARKVCRGMMTTSPIPPNNNNYNNTAEHPRRDNTNSNNNSVENIIDFSAFLRQPIPSPRMADDVIDPTVFLK